MSDFIPFQKNEKPKANCTSYNNEALLQRDVIPFMLGGNSSVSKLDVTFATHLSITRLDMLEEVIFNVNDIPIRAQK